MKNYKWKNQLIEAGLTKVEFENESVAAKRAFVSKLSGVIHAAKCGWDHLEFEVWGNESHGNIPYVLICPGEGNDSARYVNVDCDSNWAILQDVVDNLN